MAEKGHLITGVEPGSIAEEMEIVPGDRLIAVNDHEIEDVFDYRYHISAEYITLLILKKNGEEWELEIDSGGEDPGLIFESGLMSDYRSCSNKCIFCFIDQMPEGMRDTLYFKDDDSRLSFLQGNYVTLTNMKQRDLQRIIDFRLEPINISVHTTNPELRVKMLHNRFAGTSLRHIRTLYDAGIQMNGQVVLCKGWNDGEELARTLRDLLEYAPLMQSVSVVPVGLTDFRKGLCPLKPVEKEDARETIRIIEEIQRQAMERFGIHFAHASDELYLTAELPLPEEGRYDGYLQLENGVGMLRLLDNEVDEALERTESLRIPERVSAEGTDPVRGSEPLLRKNDHGHGPSDRFGSSEGAFREGSGRPASAPGQYVPERGRGPAGRCHAGGAGRKTGCPLRDHRILRRGPGKRSE